MSSDWLFFKKRYQSILKDCYIAISYFSNYRLLYLLYHFNNPDFISVSFLHNLWPFTWVYC